MPVSLVHQVALNEAIRCLVFLHQLGKQWEDTETVSIPRLLGEMQVSGEDGGLHGIGNFFPCAAMSAASARPMCFLSLKKSAWVGNITFFARSKAASFGLPMSPAACFQTFGSTRRQGSLNAAQ